MEEAEKMVTICDTLDDAIGEAFDKVAKDGDRDYWMTAPDAKKYGIIDEIILKRK